MGGPYGIDENRRVTRFRATIGRQADVEFTCTYPWRAETATSVGIRYPGTSNWSMYTAYQTTKVVLNSGFRWANMKENLKVQPFAKAPTSHMQPDNFKYKFSVAPVSSTTYAAKIQGDTPLFYGIHADVERYVN